MDLFESLFSERGFMPHGHCYLWRPEVVWLHVTSDLLTGLAYTSIPFTLLYFVRRRRDLPFSWMFLCFGLFIIACGTTHYMEVLTLWHPLYWLSGAVKAVTATVSVATAVLLTRLVPRALAVPHPAELAAVHAELKRSEARFRMAADRLAGAFLLVSAERDAGGGAPRLRVEHQNDEARTVFGLEDGGALRDPTLIDTCRRVLEDGRPSEELGETAVAEDRRAWVRQVVPLDGAVAVAQLDVTDLRRAEETRSALEIARKEARQTELLLKEVHHRIKNNLQLVSSLLNLQMKMPDGPDTKAVLRETQARIRSIALAHERLLVSSSVEKLDVALYVQDIVTTFTRSAKGLLAEVVLRAEVKGLEVAIDVAVPCGLLLNELVSNALKHAFVGREPGTVHVEVTGDTRSLIFVVRDDGVGFPPVIVAKPSRSLGLELVGALVDQLGGMLTRRDGGGTEFRLEVPLPQTAP